MNGMSIRVAVLFGRGDGVAVNAYGMDTLNRSGDRLIPALKAIGYSDDELLSLWQPQIEPDIEG